MMLIFYVFVYVFVLGMCVCFFREIIKILILDVCLGCLVIFGSKNCFGPSKGGDMRLGLQKMRQYRRVETGGELDATPQLIMFADSGSIGSQL